MANRNNRQPMGNRRMDFGRIDRSKGYGRPMPVSPWQAGGPGAPLGNILPLATSSEATLALANNLINNLLQSRQNAVPSLLDMPIRRDFGGDMNRGFDRGYNRMGNQGNFRRPTGNYVRPSDRPNSYRKPFRPNDGQRNKANQSQRKDNADFKAKPVKVESTEIAVKEGETKEETKEDGVKVEVKEEAKEEDVAKASQEDATPAAAAPAADGGKKDTPKTAYDGINPALLHCHICNKVMWDGRSFENHLNGRAHFIMMQKTAESYALTADTMRQELKIREMKHYRKLGLNAPRNFFCAMCDTYAADGAVHRTTIGHRKLKKYLHPACVSCHREMPTRIDLDEHRLTAEHLLSVQGRRKEFTAKPKPEVMVISTLPTEESYIRYDQRKRKWRGRKSAAGKDGDVEDANAEEEGRDAEAEGGDAEAEGREDVDMEKEADTERTVVDVKEGDDLAAITDDMIPAYKPERGVGRSFLAEFTCVHCKLCRKLLDSQETAEVHLRTWRHHLLFVKHLQQRSKSEGETQPTEEAAAAAAEGDHAEPAEAAGGARTENGKRAGRTDDDADGNCKRRRTTPEHDDDAAEDVDSAGGSADEVEAAPAEEEEAGDEDVEMHEQEQWEKDLKSIMKDVTEDLNSTSQGGDGDGDGEPVEPEEPEKPKAAPAQPETPTRARATRGRGRARGARARRT